ncbi:MAG: hypothetical protein HYV26_20525, partial [Candidatus Hydrogenedentes bacterium]|nr:hypothetical protein [Candidatus Hydrogenedentota bacterium]
MRRRNSIQGFMLAAVLLAAAGSSQSNFSLSVLPPTMHIGPEAPAVGAASADIACARGEWESFQVVVAATGQRLEDADASISALTSADGKSLGEDNTILYREVLIPVRHSVPRAACPPGLVPDALVPFVNPYTGEKIFEPKWREERRSGVRFGAAGFEVWPGQCQVLWVDVYVPPDTPAGFYEGTLTVTANGEQSAEIPVRLTVWDFVLPAGPAHENHFGGFGSLRNYHQLGEDTAAYERLEERYIEMMAANRINPPVPARLLPPVAEDGTAQFDEALEQRWTEFVEKHHVTNIQVPMAPFGDALGQDRAKALQFYRSWFAYLEKKGWAARAYLYMLDEPNDPEAYERVQQLGALVHEAEPRLRRLVVEQPYTQDPVWGTLDGSIDIWCPLFGFVHEASVQRVKANGNAVWSYTALVQSAPPYHPEYETMKNDNPPYWQLDFP